MLCSHRATAWSLTAAPHRPTNSNPRPHTQPRLDRAVSNQAILTSKGQATPPSGLNLPALLVNARQIATAIVLRLASILCSGSSFYSSSPPHFGHIPDPAFTTSIAPSLLPFSSILNGCLSGTCVWPCLPCPINRKTTPADLPARIISSYNPSHSALPIQPEPLQLSSCRLLSGRVLRFRIDLSKLLPAAR